MYLWLIAPRILPKRDALLLDTSPRIFSAQLNIEPDSFADGKTVAEVREKAGKDFKLITITRDSNIAITPLPDAVLRAGDRIGVRDTPDQLKEFEQVLGASLYGTEHQIDEEHPLDAGDQQLAEIVVTQGSRIGRITHLLVNCAEYDAATQRSRDG